MSSASRLRFVPTMAFRSPVVPSPASPSSPPGDSSSASATSASSPESRSKTAHERMHLTLKQQTALQPASSLRAQQILFDRFRREFNDQRPHEALGQKPPVDFYQPSSRRLPHPPWRDFDYGSDAETYRLDHLGQLHWGRHRVYTSRALSRELVALEWRNPSHISTRTSFPPFATCTATSQPGDPRSEEHTS